MSDEKVEGRANQHGGEADTPQPQVGPGDSDGNTTDRAPEVEGGQPKVGDDKPRDTEF